ncbi:major facilitator superfamily domain-containing protein [Phakopsora pachyrhizi]|uniref:Major facilitator superfamily domain-containing protein n=1 Tax=Phakopsora pachyrhizi TaxID=170000 RepID=A0AAV0BVQ6_PHAPC|nr:major facilitator superfamily domain-containing protein [Phakopsora pachyrhizi]CAH7690418.1 major facilitator superfamily domain-containing protein [Phakopsora pachyrhizi]
MSYLKKISCFGSGGQLLPFHQFRSGIYYISFTVSFGLLVDLATYGIIVPVLPFHLESLGFQHIPEKSSLLVAAYALGLIASSIPIGILGEVVKNRKIPLLICLAFLAASLVLFWASHSFAVLVISRILQGFSGTGIWTLGLALICDTVHEDKLGAIMGYVMIGWSIGTVIGPLAGGMLYESLGYNSIFIFALVIVSIDFILRLLVVDQTAIKRHRLEIDSSQATTQDYETTEVEEPAIKNSLTEEEPSIGLVTAIADSTSVEKKAEIVSNYKEATTLPLITDHASISSDNRQKTARALLSLVRCPRSWTLFVITFVLGFAFGGLLDAGMTITVNHRYGLNSRGAGLVFIAAVVPSFASSPLAGNISDKYGAKWPIIICLVLGAPFFSLLSLIRKISEFISWLAIIGFFIMGIAAPVMEDLSQVVKTTPGLGYAHVYSIFNMIYSIGALVGPLSVGSLMQHFGVERGWMVGCTICTALCAICTIPTWLYVGSKVNVTGAPSSRPADSSIKP